MRILIISRYKTNFATHILPFVVEQGEALRKAGNEVDYYLVRGGYFQTQTLRKIIKTFRPDVIHAHYGLCGITAVLQQKVPAVVTFHNGETLSMVVNAVSSFFSLKANHVIYVAQHIYDKCYFKRRKRYSILPCGVNLDECVVTGYEQARQELGFQPDIKYILFGGAFDNLRKNYPLLQEAIRMLPDYRVECVEMKELTRVEVTRLLCACDVFALPSKSEGSPQALKEAMACNCPIVATDVADIKHLLGDMPGHYLCTFEAKDVAEQLRKAFEYGRRTEGRKRIVELGLTNEHVAEALVKIYSEILNQ